MRGVLQPSVNLFYLFFEPPQDQRCWIRKVFPFYVRPKKKILSDRHIQIKTVGSLDDPVPFKLALLYEFCPKTYWKKYEFSMACKALKLELWKTHQF